MQEEPFFGAIDSRRPQIAEDAFVAPATVVGGRGRIGARSSVWYGSVLRGDDEEIIIGEDSNVQDLSVMHADPGYPVLRPVRESDTAMIGHAFESYVRKSGVHREVEPLGLSEVLPR